MGVHHNYYAWSSKSALFVINTSESSLGAYSTTFLSVQNRQYTGLRLF